MRSSRNDEILIRNLLTTILQRNMRLRQRNDTILNPLHSSLLALLQPPNIRNKRLVLMALGDAVPRQNPRKLEMRIGLNHDDLVRAVGRQVLANDARGLISGEVGADDDNVAVPRGGRLLAGELRDPAFALEGARPTELAPEEGEGVGEDLCEENWLVQHCVGFARAWLDLGERVGETDRGNSDGKFRSDKIIDQE